MEYLKDKSIRKSFVISFFCIFSLLLIYFINKENNLGVSPDSMVYIIGAENIKQGNGFVDNNGVLINHFPPIYSLTLAILALIFNSEILSVGVFANAIFFSLFFLIMNLILLKAKFSLSGMVVFNLFLLSSNFNNVFTWYTTEGMFIFEVMLLFYLILQIEDKERNFLKLILSGILSGILILTRYAGLPFVAIAFLYILISSSGINKIKNSVFFLIPLILVLGIWIFYTTTYNMPATNRKMILHPITLRNINKLISTAYSWFSPFGVKTTLVIYSAILIVIILYGRIKNFIFQLKESFLNRYNIFILSVVICIFYILFLFFSISFFDAATTLNKRILAPIFPFFLLSCAFYVRYFISNQNRIASVIFSGFISLLFIGFSYNNIKEWIYIKKYGQGYTSRQWRESDMVKQINNYKSYKIYTNAGEVIAFASNLKIASYSLPAKYSSVETVANKNYNQDINDLKKIISNGNGVIMYFSMKNRNYLINDQDLKKIFKDGFLNIQLSDGVIIKVDN